MSQIITGITNRVDMRDELGPMSLYCREYFLLSQSNSCSVLATLKKKKSLLFWQSECTCLCLHSTVILIFLNDLYGVTSQVRGFFSYALFSKSMR